MSDSATAPLTPETPAPTASPTISKVPRLNSETLRPLPLLIALAIMWFWFNQATGGQFLSGQTITYTLENACQIGIVAVGLVVVLLIAEIDLSLGSMVPLCGCSSALIMQEWVPTAPDFERMLVGVAASIIIGGLCGFWNGFWVAAVRVPSFVVTLAGLLSFQGITYLLTNSQTIAVTSSYYNALGSASPVLNDGYLANIWGNHAQVLHFSYGMLVALVVGAGYLLSLLLKRRDRILNGIGAPSIAIDMAKALALTVIGLIVADRLDYFYGVPLAVLVFLVLLLFFAYVLTRTRFGRHVYAVGGNPEAARRAGIPVQRLRWAAFVISGMMGGIAAVLVTAQFNSISVDALGPDFLLNCIAAAVIGGVSLFGGRGSIWAALLGAVILASVQGGLAQTLQGGTSSSTYWSYVVTGGILLLAVVIDTIALGGRNVGVGLWLDNVVGKRLRSART